MPCGKYRGIRIEDIPSPYLRWVADKFDDEEVALEADNEWQYREENGCHFYETY